MENNRATLYIASSWKNFHGVRMLTDALRVCGFNVVSFIEQGAEDPRIRPTDFDEWVWSEFGKKSFKFDTDGATKSDAVIYYGPAGIDAWAEVGAAWASGKIIFGLSAAKGEKVGVMRRMISEWCEDAKELFYRLDEHYPLREDKTNGET